MFGMKVWFVVLLLVPFLVTGCLGGVSTSVPEERAAIANLMDSYIEEDFTALQAWDGDLAEEDEEAFLEALAAMLDYYGDTVTVLHRMTLDVNEREVVEVEPLDLGISHYESRSFAKEKLLNHGDEIPDVVEHLEEVLVDGIGLYLFRLWLDLHAPDWEEEVLKDLVDIAENFVEEAEEPVTHDPVITVNGNTATYTITHTIDWVQEREDLDPSEFPGTASAVLQLDLEKTSAWKIVGVNVMLIVDTDAPLGEFRW